jgi:hypothetical protein
LKWRVQQDPPYGVLEYTPKRTVEAGSFWTGTLFMKTLIKLLIAAAIINATARVGLAAARYYQLKDQSQELVTFGGNVVPGELQNQIFLKAEELQLPLASEDILVTREGLRTTASAAYTDPVELFPNYKYPIRFQFRVEGVNMGAGVTPGANPLRNK